MSVFSEEDDDKVGCIEKTAERTKGGDESDLADFRFSELQIFSTLSQILAVEHAGEMGGKAAQPCSGVHMPQSSQACVLTSMMNA